MKNVFRKSTAIILAALLGMSLFSACGNSAGEKSEASESENAGKIDYTDKTFRIAWWGNETRTNMTQEIINGFKKDYPGLNVEVEYAGFGDYFTKLNTQAAGGQLPDVIQMDYNKLDGFVKNNLLENLSSYTESGAIDLSNVDDTMINGGIVNGGMYAISTGVNAQVLMYDPAVLKKANVTLSKTPTWPELLEVSEAVFKATGLKNMCAASGWESYIDMYARSLGGNLYAADGKSVAFTPEMLAKLWDYQLTAIDKGIGLKPGEYTGEESSIIKNGASWMVNAYTNNLVPYSEINGGINLEMCAFPVADNATTPPTYLKPTMFWSVTADSANKDIAVDFINYFVNTNEVYDICGSDRGMPISSKIREHLNEKASEADVRVGDYIDLLIKGNSSPIPAPIPTAGAEAAAVISSTFERITYGQYTHKDLPALAEKVVNDMNKILSSAN